MDTCKSEATVPRGKTLYVEILLLLLLCGVAKDDKYGGAGCYWLENAVRAENFKHEQRVIAEKRFEMTCCWANQRFAHFCKLQSCSLIQWEFLRCLVCCFLLSESPKSLRTDKSADGRRSASDFKSPLVEREVVRDESRDNFQLFLHHCSGRNNNSFNRTFNVRQHHLFDLKSIAWKR